ncbi:MAG: glycosyltransferase [Patescibacteria group bacterium]
MKLSVIVPAYRQAPTIVNDLRNIEAALSASFPDFEIIVVVDGKVDETLEKLSEVTSERIKKFGYDTNRGKGYALRYGVARSTGEYIAFLDAGMEINPKGVSMLWEHLKWYGADVVIGSKRHPASKVNYPLLRRLTSFGYQLLVRILFSLKVRDTQTGLKIFRRDVLEKVMPRLLVKTYAIDIEILAVANYLGFNKIYEAPVDVTHTFVSLTQKSMLRQIFRMFTDTLAVFYRLKILHYYDDKSQRKWVFDPMLQMQVNVG